MERRVRLFRPHAHCCFVSHEGDTDAPSDSEAYRLESVRSGRPRNLPAGAVGQGSGRWRVVPRRRRGAHREFLHRSQLPVAPAP
eukprot:6260479-Alexandrium_andersonii.AAC.1